MDLANLAINATPSIPFADDEFLFTDDIPLDLNPVHIHQQPVLQADVRQQQPAYGYNFPLATPLRSVAQPQYPPPSHVNYGNYAAHHDPNYVQFQHIHHGHIEPPTRTVVTPPPPPQPNINKRDLSLSPQKPKKRIRGGGPGSRGGRGSRGGKGSARGGASRGSAKSGDPASEMVDPSTLDNNGVKAEAKIEIIEDDKVFANTRWTDDERSMLFEYYLGTESDEAFEKLKSNATYAHKKVGFFSICSCNYNYSDTVPGFKVSFQWKV